MAGVVGSGATKQLGCKQTAVPTCVVFVARRVSSEGLRLEKSLRTEGYGHVRRCQTLLARLQTRESGRSHVGDRLCEDPFVVRMRWGLPCVVAVVVGIGPNLVDRRFRGSRDRFESSDG